MQQQIATVFSFRLWGLPVSKKKKKEPQANDDFACRTCECQQRYRGWAIPTSEAAYAQNSQCVYLSGKSYVRGIADEVEIFRLTKQTDPSVQPVLKANCNRTDAGIIFHC